MGTARCFNCESRYKAERVSRKGRKGYAKAQGKRCAFVRIFAPLRGTFSRILRVSG